MLRRHLPPIGGASATSATPTSPRNPTPATSAPPPIETFGRYNNLIVRNVRTREHEVMAPLTNAASFTQRRIYMHSLVKTLAQNEAFIQEINKAGGVDHVRDSMHKAGCSDQDIINYMDPIMKELEKQVTRWTDEFCVLLPVDLDPLVARLKEKAGEYLFEMLTCDSNVYLRNEYEKTASQHKRSHMEQLQAVADEYKYQAERFIEDDDNFHDIVTDVMDVSYLDGMVAKTIGEEYRRIAELLGGHEAADRIFKDTAWKKAGEEFMDNLMGVEWSQQVLGNVVGPMRSQFIRTFIDPIQIERRAHHITLELHARSLAAANSRLAAANNRAAALAARVPRETHNEDKSSEPSVIMQGILVPNAHLTIDGHGNAKLKEPMIGECLQEVSQMTIPQMYGRAVKIKTKIIDIDLAASETEQDLLKSIRVLEIIEANLPNGLLRKLKAQFDK